MKDNKKHFTFNDYSKGNIKTTSDKKLDAMAKMRTEGVSFRKIAKQFNTTCGNVHGLLKKWRPVSLMSVNPEGYLTVRQYAKKYNITVQAVYDRKHINEVDYIKANGKLYVKDEKKTIPHKLCSYDEICEMIELRETGMKVDDVAKKLNRHRSTILKHTSFYFKGDKDD